MIEIQIEIENKDRIKVAGSITDMVSTGFRTQSVLRFRHWTFDHL